MILHLLLKESDATKLCPYCLEEVELKSVFFYDTHYKSAKCDCGKTVTVKVDFSGSGDDDYSTIDSVLK